ncbi:unnamed protein product [Nippostrongylus brasiliensis]|uniref:SCP domain-containing protein n=1 Tax=Nippostrongylus brasiliensis TaxID=27835 RepID=A0A0N4YFX5_NIPBR|nr:unnamed protein product [Nippostrongylus brasiliensis]
MAPIGHIPLIVLAFVIAFHVGIASGTDIIGKCSDADKMTNSVRKAFLLMHNKLRSRVARGKITGKDGPVPKAARMLKMVYDCKVEKTAMRHAKKCKFQHSKKNERPGLGENIYQVQGMKKSFEESANASSQAWFDEIKDPGMPKDNVLTLAVFNRPKQIGHYTQMVWQKSFRLGCAVVDCGNTRYFTVCQYGPAGNFIGKKLYDIGEPCKKDADCKCEGCKCKPKSGLCVKPV